MDEFDAGAHGVGNLIPQRVRHDFLGILRLPSGSCGDGSVVDRNRLNSVAGRTETQATR